MKHAGLTFLATSLLMCTVQLRAAKRSLSTCTRRGDFHCLDGQCISRRRRCDGKVDCDDGSDEQIGCKRRRKRFSCYFYQYQCSNGNCVSSQRKCDGYNNCGDNSDEWWCDATPTPLLCTRSEFLCDNGHCTLQAFVCDGDNDCGDYSDERACPTTSAPCHYYRFQCANGRCVSRSYICDGHNDCGDDSDEWSCPTTSAPYCSWNQFRCHNGRCVLQSYVCDGDNDCWDHSDEENCRYKELSAGATIGIAFAVGIVVFLVVVGTMIAMYVREKRQRRRQLRVTMTTTTTTTTSGGSSRVVFAPSSHAGTVRMGPHGREASTAESALPTYEEVMGRSSGEPSGRVERSEEQARAFVQREGRNL